MNIRSRRSLIVISGVLLLVVVGGAMLYALPTVARHVAISQLRAITKRPVSIDRVDVQLLSGRFAIHGLHVAEPDGAPLADFERLEARLNVLAALRGHIWARELVLGKQILRTVRLGKDFNFSDLVEGSGTICEQLEVNVDRFTLGLAH